MTHILVPYVDLCLQNLSLRSALHKDLDDLLDSGQFILGGKVLEFESDLINYTGSQFCTSVSNGTSALFLALKGLGIGAGDEVITPPNSYLASTSSIVLSGAKPKFCDINTDLNISLKSIEKNIGPNTKAVLAVHLTGKPCEIDKLVKLCERYNLKLIEDCAQAIGATYFGKHVGTFGDAGCFSTHPLKNLSALGDGGFVLTNNERLDKWLKLARNHGHSSRDECEFWSHNMRLDALQASFLSTKLRTIENVVDIRRSHAEIYFENISDVVNVPTEGPNMRSVYHTFVIQTPNRDALGKFLLKNGIETKIHYPKQIVELAAATDLAPDPEDIPNSMRLNRTVLSLPIAEYLSTEQILYVAQKIREFFK